MIIQITPQTTIADIQEKFSSIYPFLKIQFSHKAHQNGDRAEKARWYASSFRISSVVAKLKTDFISLRPWHQTGIVEQEFENKFGLHAQIFRKEGEEWIETAGTDVFTLSEQNDIGRRITKDQHAQLWIEREKLL